MFDAHGPIEIAGRGFFPDLPRAVASLNPGDVLRVHRSIEISDSVTLVVPFRLEGANGTPQIILRGILRSERGMIVTQCDGRIRNIEFVGARCLNGNGAGVWHERGRLVLEDCIFSGNQNGVLVADDATGSFSAAGCYFHRNGGGCGHTHALYINRVASARIYRCVFEETYAGHHIKSKARACEVRGNLFSGSPMSTTAYMIDFPYGGYNAVTRNIFIKPRDSMNRAFIALHSAESRPQSPSARIENNIFINYRRGLSVGVVNFSPRSSVVMRENAFERVSLPLLGRGRQKLRRDIRIAFADGITKGLANDAETISDLGPPYHVTRRTERGAP
ncbi:MAG: right-handed parallel beta-helix repeat-containing protein [Alphaproteobacteria bacterium]|nr:right-handed parallel beta-helix repeat-containing protein [Alphaproteobacteria bacterium]